MVTLLSLRAVNFRRLNIQEPLTFPKGLIIIKGRNEAGKSTILEAILYGLYGDFRIPGALRNARGSLENVVNYRASRAEVEVVFEVRDKRYKVKRIIESGREGGRQVDARLFEFTGNGWLQRAAGVSEVNEMVQKLISVSWREMLATNVIAQKDLERIVRMEKGDRERIINMMMGFESYDKASEKFSEEVRNLHSKLNETKKECDLLDEAIAQLREKSKNLESWKRELEDLKRKIPELEAEEKKESEICRYVNELERSLREKLRRKLELESIARERKGTEEKLADINSNLKHLAIELENLRRELRDLEPLEKRAEENLVIAENEWKKYSGALEKAKELWNSYLAASRELAETEEIINKLKERLKGEENYLKEKEEINRSLEKIENQIKSVRVPRWSTAASLSIAVSSILLLPIHWLIALLGLALSAILILLGLQAKQRLIERLHHERGNLRERASKLDSELRVLERDREELKRLSDKGSALKERLNELLVKLSTISAGRSGLVEFNKLVQDLQEAAERNERAYREALKRRNELADRRSKLEVLIKKDEEQLQKLNMEIKGLESKLRDLESKEKSIREDYDRIAIQEPPFDIDGLLWPVVEDEVEYVADVRRLHNELYSEVRAELEKTQAESNRLSKMIEEVEKEMQRLPELAARLGELKREMQALELEIKAREEAIGALKAVAAKRRAAFAPSVENNMNWFVSYITGGRYKAVKIDPNTYDVEVFDVEGGKWLGRDIYSGGTNDQFLLAMRIAFTLSLLPATKGTYPRFLFLDEPLGSSDTERRSRIVELLTRELTRFFDQVFLITHVDVEEPPGSIAILMEDGKPRITYTTSAIETETFK